MSRTCFTFSFAHWRVESTMSQINKMQWAWPVGSTQRIQSQAMPKVRGSFTKFWKAQFWEAISRKQFWILRCRKIRNRRHRLARKWKCPILCALRRKIKKRNEKRRVRRNRFRSNVATTMPPCSHLEQANGSRKRCDDCQCLFRTPATIRIGGATSIFSLAKAKAKRARVSPPR